MVNKTINFNNDDEKRWERAEKDNARWQEFKAHSKHGIEILLGSCDVSIKIIDGKLCFKINPNEIVHDSLPLTFHEGYAINIKTDENDCYIDDILKITRNCKNVSDAKKSGKLIKNISFTKYL
jgi:hypothetical protein